MYVFGSGRYNLYLITLFALYIVLHKQSCTIEFLEHVHIIQLNIRHIQCITYCYLTC